MFISVKELLGRKFCFYFKMFISVNKLLGRKQNNGLLGNILVYLYIFEIIGSGSKIILWYDDHILSDSYIKQQIEYMFIISLYL